MNYTAIWYDWHEGIVELKLEESDVDGVHTYCNDNTFVVSRPDRSTFLACGGKKSAIDSFMRSNHDRRAIIGLGGQHLLAAKDEDAVNNAVGTVDVLCLLTQSIKQLSVPHRIVQVSCSEAHFLIATDHDVYSYGVGDCGQLGLGKGILRTDSLVPIKLPQGETPRCISTATEHSAIVTRPGGILYTFGSSKYARLGHGTDLLEDNVYEPRIVEMLLGTGQLLPNGTTTGSDLVACGKWHTLAASVETSDVYGWGWNKYAQISPEGTTFHQHIESMLTEPQRLAVLDDLLGEVEHDGRNKIKQLCAGTRFSAILTAGGKLITM